MIYADGGKSHEVEFKMEFTLIYEGALKSNGDPRHKHQIREAIRPQLEELWRLLPLSSIHAGVTSAVPAKTDADDVLGDGFSQVFRSPDCRVERNGTCFLPVVSSALKLRARVDITWFRPEHVGRVIQTGDIDNRLKTLFDAMQIPPHENQFPPGGIVGSAESPFCCLLEDDSLISGLNVDTRRMLKPTSTNDVLLLIRVTTQTDEINFGNIQLI